MALPSPDIPGPFLIPLSQSATTLLRLEVRHGLSKPTVHEVSGATFLVGTVPGCDLRVPGLSLPSVSCLFTTLPNGVELRKLAPLQPLQVNGQPTTHILLSEGDRIALGAVEIVVLDLPKPGKAPFPRLAEAPEVPSEPEEALAALRVELAQQQRDLAAAVADLERREQALARPQELVTPPLAAPVEERRASSEIERASEELNSIKRQLYERYRHRRDRLAGMREALRRAGHNLQERKQRFDAEASALAQRREETAIRQAQLAEEKEALTRRHQELEALERRIAEGMETTEREARARFEALAVREQRFGEEARKLAESQAEHQAALARLERAQARVEEREASLRRHASEADHRFEALQRASREMEEHAEQLEAWRQKVQADEAELQRARADHERAVAELARRSSAVEGQQTMLATLRTRLERLREVVRREEEALTQSSARIESAEAALHTQTRELEQQKAEFATERALFEQQRQALEERAPRLEEAVARLRQAQEAQAAQEERLKQREEYLGLERARLEEEGGLVRGRAEQTRQLQERLEADRQQLKERAAALAQAEMGIATLQEQLRRRAEALSSRQREQEERIARAEEGLATLEARRAEVDARRQEAEAAMALANQELERQTAGLARREAELARHEELLRENGRRIGAERKSLLEERRQREAERQQAETALSEQKTHVEGQLQQALTLQQLFPELETRARASLDRLAEARAHLRQHLNELHTYAAQGRQDLETLRRETEAEADRVRLREETLGKERDEHRLAVAAFRQQLIDWQAQVAEMKRSLAQGETRLERRQAEVDEQARQVEDTSARLAREAQQLQEERRLVAERRGEVEQHLEDMREWYRRKLRELTGVETPPESEEPTPAPTLPLADDLDPGDRALGALLRSLELVDAPTLGALLAEARRQRRSLRQLLLAGNYLTLYQMALIEAGNLDALMLGPVRLIDRLQSTPRESVYRVFDPRHGREALLRHLAEEEAEDAVRPDEFRQRFSALAGVRNSHLIETYEVLEIAERPAVLQEWLSGVPASEWPALTAMPGVWYRLLTQAMLGLHALHQGGLVHGRVRPGRVVLTPEGVVKLCGGGEPAWLAAASEEEEGDPQSDLLAVGMLASAWAMAGSGKSAKPLPDALRMVLERLTSPAAEDRYRETGAVLEDLERASATVPASTAAWDRLLRQVREQAAAGNLRISA